MIQAERQFDCEYGYALAVKPVSPTFLWTLAVHFRPIWAKTEFSPKAYVGGKAVIHLRRLTYPRACVFPTTGSSYPFPCPRATTMGEESKPRHRNTLVVARESRCKEV